MPPSSDYYAMPTEHDDDNSAETDIEALSETALEYYQQGHLRQAHEICHRILRKQQRPVAVLILAKIAHRQNDFGEAVECYEQFLRMVPDHGESHFRLGIVLDECGRTRRAINHYEKSISLGPGSDAVFLRLGDACGKIERWEQAITAYRQAIAIQPDNVEIIIKLGNALIAAQQFTVPVALYTQALARIPESARLHRHLGVVLQQLGSIHEAVECFERALELQPVYVAALVDFARSLLLLGRAEEAIPPLQQATNIEPDNSEANIGLALTFRQLGRTDHAALQLEQLLARRPACGEAHYHISMIQPDSGHVARVEDVLRDSGLSKSNAGYCHFALGNLLQNEESFDQAFEHIEKANTLQRETFDYDAEQHSQTISRLISVYSKDYFDNKRQFGSDSELPVFIVGMPRSGTTLVEQILSSHPLVHGAGELDAIRGTNLSIASQLNSDQPLPECMAQIDSNIAQEHAARYLRILTRHCPSAVRITDKLPGNYIAIGLIKTLLPKARIVHCMRNELDNCISLYFHCFPAAKYSFDQADMASYYLDYQRLMAHWQSLFHDDIFTVGYEDLVQHQATVTRQLVDYVGLDWDNSCLDYQNNERNVSSPSNMQIRQPIYRSSMNRWKRYENHLQPLVDALSGGAAE